MTNVLAVVVSAIVSFVIGGLWFGPLFGKTWMNLMGFTPKDMEAAKKKGMAKSYVSMFVGTLVMAYVLANFVRFAGAMTAAAGAMIGFWAWLGFVAPVMLGSVLWEGKPMKLYVLNVAHYLVALAVVGAIVAVWT